MKCYNVWKTSVSEWPMEDTLNICKVRNQNFASVSFTPWNLRIFQCFVAKIQLNKMFHRLFKHPVDCQGELYRGMTKSKDKGQEGKFMWCKTLTRLYKAFELRLRIKNGCQFSWTQILCCINANLNSFRLNLSFYSTLEISQIIVIELSSEALIFNI